MFLLHWVDDSRPPRIGINVFRFDSASSRGFMVKWRLCKTTYLWRCRYSLARERWFNTFTNQTDEDRVPCDVGL